eukprot:scaffold63880_cov19-Tisochrysis_lutea.AAC.1
MHAGEQQEHQELLTIEHQQQPQYGDNEAKDPHQEGPRVNDIQLQDRAGGDKLNIQCTRMQQKRNKLILLVLKHHLPIN